VSGRVSGGADAVRTFRVADGLLLRVIGGPGADCGPLQFSFPHQLWVADDDFVFVADCFNNRVQVLTPALTFHCFVGVGELVKPVGVCANADVVVVSEVRGHRVSVFSRGDGALIRRFGARGTGDGQLRSPRDVCFMCSDTRVAVADNGNNRVCVFTLDGAFVHHVGVGILTSPTSVACSAWDELVVGDWVRRCVRVFASGGVDVKTFGTGGFTAAVVHGGSVVTHDPAAKSCVVFE
jgi:DNA-binding beta-propeller fold protein YncE